MTLPNLPPVNNPLDIGRFGIRTASGLPIIRIESITGPLTVTTVTQKLRWK